MKRSRVCGPSLTPSDCDTAKFRLDFGNFVASSTAAHGRISLNPRRHRSRRRRRRPDEQPSFIAGEAAVPPPQQGVAWFPGVGGHIEFVDILCRPLEFSRKADDAADAHNSERWVTLSCTLRRPFRRKMGRWRRAADRHSVRPAYRAAMNDEEMLKLKCLSGTLYTQTDPEFWT